MQREDYSPLYSHQNIPDFVSIMKEPKNIAEIFKLSSEYISEWVDLKEEVIRLRKELNEEKQIKNIAIEIINKHNLSDEMNEECWKRI